MIKEYQNFNEIKSNEAYYKYRMRMNTNASVVFYLYVTEILVFERNTLIIRSIFIFCILRFVFYLMSEEKIKEENERKKGTRALTRVITRGYERRVVYGGWYPVGYGWVSPKVVRETTLETY